VLGVKLDPRDRARRLVVLPARSGDVAAHDALDRQHPQLAHDQRPPAHFAGNGVGRGDQVVGDDLLRLLEPENRQSGQHLALVGDRRGMDRVVGRDPVARDHQQLLVQRVHLTDLAFGDQVQVDERGHVARC
jgi:hypothetical protein